MGKRRPKELPTGVKSQVEIDNEDHRAGASIGTCQKPMMMSATILMVRRMVDPLETLVAPRGLETNPMVKTTIGNGTIAANAEIGMTSVR